MTQKRKNLAAALSQPAEPVQPPSPTPAPASDAGGPVAGRRDRDGMVNIAAWFPLAVKFELEELRLKRSREIGRKITVQELMAEALNDLFKKHGRPELAPSRSD